MQQRFWESDGSCLFPSAWCWLLPGSADIDTGSPTKIIDECPDYSTSGPPPDVKRPSRVSPYQKSVIRCPTPRLMLMVSSCPKTVTISKGLEELAREIARVQGQPVGKEEHSETSDESGPLLVPKSAWVVSGRRHHRLAHADRSFDVSKWKVGGVAPGATNCENPRSSTNLSNRVRGRSSNV